MSEVSIFLGDGETYDYHMEFKDYSGPYAQLIKETIDNKAGTYLADLILSDSGFIYVTPADNDDTSWFYIKEVPSKQAILRNYNAFSQFVEDERLHVEVSNAAGEVAHVLRQWNPDISKDTIPFSGADALRIFAEKPIEPHKVIYKQANGEYVPLNGKDLIQNFKDTILSNFRSGLHLCAFRILTQSALSDAAYQKQLKVTQNMAMMLPLGAERTRSAMAADVARAQQIQSRSQHFTDYIKQTVQLYPSPVMVDVIQKDTTYIFISFMYKGEPSFLWMSPYVGVLYRATDAQPILLYDIHSMSLSECYARAQAFGFAEMFKVFDLRSNVSFESLIAARKNKTKK